MVIRKIVLAVLLTFCITAVLFTIIPVDSSARSSLRVNGLFASASGPLVTVHFIYVGQGDSILVDAQGVEVLIDGGPTSAGSTVLSYLSGLGVQNLTLMVATHMHEDHIGGLIAVLNSSIHVNEVLTNNESYTTETYTKFMALAQTHTLIVAQRGQVYTLTSTVNLTVYNPVQPLEFTDQNENSVVLKLQAGETSFLLEGDASLYAEASMINAGLDLHSNVLKVGHHGSANATTDAFLNAVQPTYAVISCGINNQYGFPAPETLQRLSNHNVTTYGTYTSGTIIATSDGTTIAFARDNVKPVAEAGPDQTVNQGSLVHFNGANSSDNVGIIGYNWTFTDGAPKTLTGSNPTYTFNTPGIYVVRLNVTDAIGNWNTDNVTITVLDTIPPAIGTTSRNPSGVVNQGILVKVSVNITDGGSGVKNATLLYTIDNGNSWEAPQMMSYNITTHFYETTIPGQSAGTTVKYKIVAYDNAGNQGIQNNAGQYYVSPTIPELSLLTLTLFMMATLLVVIIYRRKRLQT